MKRKDRKALICAENIKNRGQEIINDLVTGLEYSKILEHMIYYDWKWARYKNPISLDDLKIEALAITERFIFKDFFIFDYTGTGGIEIIKFENHYVTISFHHKNYGSHSADSLCPNDDMEDFEKFVIPERRRITFKNCKELRGIISKHTIDVYNYGKLEFAFERDPIKQLSL